MSKLSETLRGLGLGAEEIASKARLPVERVQAILNGGHAPLAEVRAISSGLRVPLRVFATGHRSGESSGELNLLFRGPREAKGKLDVTVERVATFVEAALRILPKKERMPRWLDKFQVNDETYEEAERIASQFRQFFFPDREFDPLLDLSNVLDVEANVIVSRINYSQYEGVSLIADNYCFVFVSPRFSGRMLFTLAHELGHLIAHHRSGHAPVFERASSIGNYRHRTRSEGFVDAFASNLLLPDKGVARALQTIRSHYDITSPSIGDIEIILVARYFGVSFDVAARRCEDLELIPIGGAFSLSDKIKKDFGSAEKRADALGLPSRPTVEVPTVSPTLSASISQAISQGAVSIGWAADRFSLSLGEILAGNAKTTLS